MTSNALESQGPPEQALTSESEPQDLVWLDELTPSQIVSELDKYIIGQDDAKKAVAIVLRNRWRRQRVEEEMRHEIAPNNLILIGPTGVGKTEIARRLAGLAGAPFLKVEASKFTEVGYVGRDVESMIRDLVDISINLVRADREDEVQETAGKRAEERILELLLPVSNPDPEPPTGDERPHIFVAGPTGVAEEQEEGVLERRQRTREKLRKLLIDGKLEDREIEIEVSQAPNIEGMMIPVGGGDGLDHHPGDEAPGLFPPVRGRRGSRRIHRGQRDATHHGICRVHPGGIYCRSLSGGSACRAAPCAALLPRRLPSGAFPRCA